MQIDIITSSKFLNEKKYILDVFFNEFLGIPYSFILDDNQINYLLRFKNKTLEVKDDFFGKITGETFLVKKYIPKSIDFFEYNFAPEKDIPVLYGESKIEIQSEEAFCGIDIFASSFFMLTRWEELVSTKRDAHDRFLESEALAIKHNFYKRPIVNEYVELLWNIIKVLGFNGTRKTFKYEPIITHDVDEIQRYPNVKRYFRAIAGDITYRKSPLNAIQTTKEYLSVLFGKQKDPYDIFDWLMDQSEKNGLISRFYFVPTLNGEEDFQYEINSSRVKNIIENIQSRGHVVGIHGSYGGYNNTKRFFEEKNRFDKMGVSVTEGRQHFLRFKNPETWRAQENAGIKIDSTIGFYDHIGFRAGTCFQYPIFDVIERRVMDIYELPLIFMEGPLVDMKLLEETFINEIIELSTVTKKYKGKFVFLWHPNAINHPYYKKYSKNYSQIIEKIN